MGASQRQHPAHDEVPAVSGRNGAATGTDLLRTHQ
jgi:hypothetical protein